MLRDLMHSLTGTVTSSTATQLATAMHNTVRSKVSKSKRIFQGNIEVLHVSNGYVVNISTKEGYEHATHIARTIVEVNEIIAAAMVAFQLENS